MKEITRKKLPDERASITHKFQVADQEGYLIVGLYPDGTPGELFVSISKEGSTISGLMDAICLATSLLLQYGVPLEIISRKYRHTNFEPSGLTGNKKIPMASSLLDYIFHWLDLKFGEENETSKV